MINSHFSMSLTSLRPHPNPLPEGEGANLGSS